MINKVTCSNCKSHRCFVKRHCAQEWISIINKKKTQNFYSKGKNIINENSAVLGIYFICKGKAKVTSVDHNNNTRIIRLATDGLILGHRGFGKQSYPIGAVAMDNSLVCFLDNALVHELMMHNPEFTYGMMACFSQELHDAELRVKNWPHMTVKERVADSILHVMDVFGLTSQNKLDIEISLKEIGAMAGTNAEQVGAIIKELIKDMILMKEQSDIIVLDPIKLSALLRK